MEKAAVELRSCLPVLLGLGVQCILPPIDDEQLALYDGILKEDGDEREGKDTNFLLCTEALFTLIKIRWMGWCCKVILISLDLD